MTIRTDHLPDDSALAAEAAAMMHARQDYDWIPDPNLSRAFMLVRPEGTWLVALAAGPEALEGAVDVLGTLPDCQEPSCLVGLYLVCEVDGPDGPAYRVQPVGVCNPEGVEPVTFAGVLVLEGARAAECDTSEVAPLHPARRN